jgi:hypothetical protein
LGGKVKYREGVGGVESNNIVPMYSEERRWGLRNPIPIGDVPNRQGGVRNKADES